MTKDEQIEQLQSQLKNWNEAGQIALKTMEWVGTSYFKGFYTVDYELAMDKLRECLLKNKEE